MRTMELINRLSENESDVVFVRLNGKEYRITKVFHYGSKLVAGQEVTAIEVEEFK